MKALIYRKYGSPDELKLEDVPKSTPADNEVLIKIHATALNYADGALLTGTPFLVRMMTGGILKPKNQILGADVAGRIEAVGKNVTRFQPGDEVFGDLANCGWGGLAEYVCAPENILALKPANISFEEAAAAPMAAVTALQGLRKGQIQSGQTVLVNGASGGVGTFAVQIAKSFGTEVTAVCSARNIDKARAIGADHVIDYKREDFTKNGRRYDLILAANGYHPLADYKRTLNPQGNYICAGGSMSQIFQSMLLGPFMSMTGDKTLTNIAAKSNHDDLIFVKELLETGKVVPVIDRCYPLSEAPEAFRYLREGHAKGKIIVMPEHSSGKTLL